MKLAVRALDYAAFGEYVLWAIRFVSKVITPSPSRSPTSPRAHSAPPPAQQPLPDRPQNTELDDRLQSQEDPPGEQFRGGVSRYAIARGKTCPIPFMAPSPPQHYRRVDGGALLWGTCFAFAAPRFQPPTYRVGTTPKLLNVLIDEEPACWYAAVAFAVRQLPSSLGYLVEQGGPLFCISIQFTPFRKDKPATPVNNPRERSLLFQMEKYPKDCQFNIRLIAKLSYHYTNPIKSDPALHLFPAHVQPSCALHPQKQQMCSLENVEQQVLFYRNSQQNHPWHGGLRSAFLEIQ